MQLHLKSSKNIDVNIFNVKLASICLAIIIVFLFKTVLFSAHAYSQSTKKAENLKDQFESFKVDRVEFRGLKRIEPEALLERISSNPGSLATAQSIKADIDKIYKLRYFSGIEVHREIRDNSNVIIYKLQEKPIIAKVLINGNDEVDDDDVKSQIKTKEFSIIDIGTIQSDVTVIQKLYEDKGFYLAKVSYVVDYKEKESAVVKFNIQEFDKVKVKKVTFLGNKEIKDDELKDFMLTKEDSLFSGLSGSGNFKEFNFQADIERLAYYYRTKGYLQINIGNPWITVSEDRKWIFITLQISEGPKFSVNDISFSGDLLFSDSEFLQDLTLKVGDDYSEDKLRQDIQKLTEMYQDKGYAFANVLRTLEPISGENKVNINYSFEKGKIAYFGKIIVKGNSKTRDKVVRRELKVHEGMMYSGSKIRISKDNVNRLGFFESNGVIFNTVSRKGSDNILDLEIVVKERQTGQISVGAGYSTGSKGFLQASIRQSNFNGKGQDLDFSLNLSRIEQTYRLGFTEPYFMDTKWTLGGQIHKTRSSNISISDYEKEGFDVKVGYPIFTYARLFSTYSWEQTDLKGSKSPTIKPEIENGVASGIELALIYDRRNNSFEPTKGFFGSMALEYVGLGFDHRWLKAESEGRFYYPVYKELVFRSRVRAAQLIRTTERPVPRIEKFAMGGARNMRGYSLEDIGPRENLQNYDGTYSVYNIGGLFSILGSVELEHPLIQEAGLKWAVFYDAGNVYESAWGTDGDYRLRTNWGFGMRWFSPIGVLRFEMGFPIQRREGEQSNQFHFDIGQIF